MTCNFTLKHYEEICKKISESQYKICFFNEYSPDYKDVIILRHDVDLDLEQSMKIANIENKYNIKSTFFLWLRSPFYNIFEKRYSDIVNAIINLGHQIGLHFDESVYKIENEIDLDKYIENETNLIKNYFSINIHAVSMHRPSKWLLDNNIKLNKYINTYEKRFFKDFKYFSDSQRQWKEGCVCKKIDINKYDKLHILIHPIWWIEDNVNFSERMSDFIMNKFNKTEIDLENNILAYKKIKNSKYRLIKYT